MMENQKSENYWSKNNIPEPRSYWSEDRYTYDAYMHINDTAKHKSYTVPQAAELLNKLNAENWKLKKELHMYKTKYNRQVDELAECYSKLGW